MQREKPPPASGGKKTELLGGYQNDTYGAIERALSRVSGAGNGEPKKKTELPSYERKASALLWTNYTAMLRLVEST